MKPKFVFVIGGVMSGIGKGVFSSSLGRLIKDSGFNVNHMKVDPYLNVDAGTMNPLEHGEIFVTDDGLETDQDVGNYERFTERELNRNDYLTSGMLYRKIIEKERLLEYGGKCIEAMGAAVDEIIEYYKISANESKCDVLVVEIGGTLGDFQNELFIEAMRRMKCELAEDVCVAFVCYAPFLKNVSEIKTRPVQHAISDFLSCGMSPDMVLVRSENKLEISAIEKIGNSSGLKKGSIFSLPDVESIYVVPKYLAAEGVLSCALDILGLKSKSGLKMPDIDKLIKNIEEAKSKPCINIGLVGKYFYTRNNTIMADVYHSVIESLKIAAAHNQSQIKIHCIDSKQYDDENIDIYPISKYDGIIVPGGFGEVGVNGMIRIIRYARENNIPFFGICYGMQMAVVEFAKNVLGMDKATSKEIDKDTSTPVVTILESQKENIEKSLMGGTMRLGGLDALVQENSKLFEIYGCSDIRERHRHRYEINPEYKNEFEKRGMKFSVMSKDGKYIEAFELSSHPFFIGVQYHPEFLTKVTKPHPLFKAFIVASEK